MYNIRNFLYERRKSMKKKFMRVLTLASCVALMSGCSGKKGEEPAEIKVSVHDVPAEFVVGQEIDLDSYVTIEGSSESYSVELSEASKSIASVSGHKITVTGEGTVSFTVKLGGMSGTGSFSTIYSVRKEFRDLYKDTGDNYVGYRLVIDSQEETVSLGAEFTHGDKYSYDQKFMQVSATDYLPGGFVEVDEEIFSYVLVEGAEEGKYEPKFMINGDEPYDISEVAAPFSIDPSSLVYGDEEESWFENDSVLYLNADKAGKNEAAIKSLLQVTDNFDDYGLKFSRAKIERFDLEWEDTETGAKSTEEAFVFVLLVTNGTKEGYWDMGVICNDSDHKIDEIEEYLESEAVPTGYSFAYFNQVIDLFAEAPFTLSTVYGSYLNGSAPLTDEQKEAVAAQFSPTSYGAAFLGAEGQVNAYVTETQILVEEVGLDHLTFGYVENDDKIYSYSYVPGEGEAEGSYEAKLATGVDSFADLDPEENFSFLLSTCEIVDPRTGEPYTVYDEIFVNSITQSPHPVYEGISVVTAEFCGYTGFDFLAYLMFYSTPTTGQDDRYGLGDIFYALYDLGMLNDLEVYVSVITDGESVYGVSVSAMFAYAEITAGEVYWGFQTGFSSLPMPEIEIVYPSEAPETPETPEV